MVGTSKRYKRERNFEILRLRESGMKYAEIGKMYGICVETVRQICLKARRVQRDEARGQMAE